MSEHYDLKQIEVLSDEELRILCYDEFLQIYNHFGKKTGRSQALALLTDDGPLPPAIEIRSRQSVLGVNKQLLLWVMEHIKWVFSGIGVAIIMSLIAYCATSPSPAIEEIATRTAVRSTRDITQQTAATGIASCYPDCSKTNFSRANLIEADFRGIDLNGANLSGADLTEADLRGVSLIKANLRGANLIKANLIGTNFTEADLIGADLTGAFYDNSTIWPSDFEPPSSTISLSPPTDTVKPEVKSVINEDLATILPTATLPPSPTITITSEPVLTSTNTTTLTNTPITDLTNKPVSSTAQHQEVIPTGTPTIEPSPIPSESNDEIRIVVTGVGKAPDTESNLVLRERMAILAAEADADRNYAKWKEGVRLDAVTIIGQGAVITDTIREIVQAHVYPGNVIEQHYDEATDSVIIKVEYIIDTAIQPE